MTSSSDSAKPLAGKVALITGAASGIGRATAIQFAADGATVFGADFNEGGLKETLSELEGSGATASGISLNVSDSASVKACVDAVIEAYGRVDVLCNIAGVLHFENTHQVEDADWQRIIDVNLTGTFFMARAVLEHMVAQGSGVILNTASSAGHIGTPWAAAYSASKGGVLSMTRTLAIEYGRQGVRCCSVSPAGITTPIMNEFAFPEGSDHSLLPRIMNFDGTFGPENVAWTLAFLASDKADRLNGIDIKVDDAMMA